MRGALFYCRAGFEKDLANEVMSKAAESGIYGYPQLNSNTGWVLFNCHNPQEPDALTRQLDFSQLIFARQMATCAAVLEQLDPSDRVTPIVEASQDLLLCGDIRVEYPDTTEGRELSKFCRKITVPLRNALRKAGKLTDKPHSGKPVLLVFFPDGKTAMVGYCQPRNSSSQPLGIMRLKFPQDAPSRSTLKLDEAFQMFVPGLTRDDFVGQHAVDLGACPGGWTYQLVRRGMFVQAIDNGAMDDALMETGQVRYFAEDGFKYEPKKKNVHWLVCDMIEQPQRVAALMANWLKKGWCKEAIFNLKLPMKRRFESVTEAFEIIDNVLADAPKPYRLQAKHLYHDREEITVHLAFTR